MHPLKKMIEQRKSGKLLGITSCCSANEFVIRAALRHSKKNGNRLLIESTANQVNQYGGYTGYTPADFRDYVMNLAKEESVNPNKIILGGDHLGPLVWGSEDPEEAMRKSEELVAAYASAGFTKIHIDTSMPLAGESRENGFGTKVIAQRSARLFKAAENARKNTGIKEQTVYVIGSEVPIPGGAVCDEAVEVTKPREFESELNIFRKIYEAEGLDFGLIIGFVVQPGVEFTNDSVHEYNREKAKELMKAKNAFEDIVFEGHSTDYQTKEKLSEMVEDGVAVLKVGPALTFAMREGLYALENIAKEMSGKKEPTFRKTLMSAMDKNTVYWKKHYTGNDEDISYQKNFGLSDRCRYYMNEPEVKQAAEELIQFFENKNIPYALLRQYMPVQAAYVLSGKLNNNARDLLYNKIEETLDEYLYATGVLN